MASGSDNATRTAAVRTVLVLGGSYAGARAAELLAKDLPEGWRVVMLERQSHFKHLYLFPRFSVLNAPSHAWKGFIPFDGILPLQEEPELDEEQQHSDASPTAVETVPRSTNGGGDSVDSLAEETSTLRIPDATLNNQLAGAYASSSSSSTDSSSSQSTAPTSILTSPTKSSPTSSTSLGPLDEPPPEFYTRASSPVSGGARQRHHRVHGEALTITDTTVRFRHASGPLCDQEDTIAWDYLVCALGSALPPPLQSPALTKLTGIAHLEAQQEMIARAKSVLIIGGGALGLQYATDIAEVYNHADGSARAGVQKKDVTLVHSRTRLLPLYDQQLHDAALERLASLGVRVILGARVDLPAVDDDEENAGEGPLKMKTLQAGGQEIYYDLLLRCTGQSPRSELVRDWRPEILDEHGYVKVLSTLQVASDTEALQNVFAIGDVAAAGVIKAGHTGWNQAGIAVENVLRLISNLGSELLAYQKSLPQIKVTLGLTHAISELLPNMDDEKTIIVRHQDGKLDGGWEHVWKRMGVEPPVVAPGATDANRTLGEQ